LTHVDRDRSTRVKGTKEFPIHDGQKINRSTAGTSGSTGRRGKLEGLEKQKKKNEKIEILARASLSRERRDLCDLSRHKATRFGLAARRRGDET